MAPYFWPFELQLPLLSDLPCQVILHCILACCHVAILYVALCNSHYWPPLAADQPLLICFSILLYSKPAALLWIIILFISYSTVCHHEMCAFMRNSYVSFVPPNVAGSSIPLFLLLFSSIWFTCLFTVLFFCFLVHVKVTFC